MALALALKYRPTTFADLIGQESVAKTLSLALEKNRIAHAYLFSGLRGSGKTSSARIFARALQCEKAPINDPCNQCSNCLQSLENRHLDIIEMDAASSRKIDDIRNLIEQTKYAPSYGKYKIFIIDEVHMLTKEAFNALLKTLEEPPSAVKFILATTDPLKLPATILSRTQHFRFKKIPHKLIINHLENILMQENITYQKEALEIIARSGNGSLRDTLTLTDQAISYCNANITSSKITEMLGVVDPQILQNFFNAIEEKDNAKIKNILEIFEEYETEMILDEMILYLKENFHSNPNFSLLILERYLKILAESKNLLNFNCDGGFVLLLTSLKMQEAQKLSTINEEILKLEESLKTQPMPTIPTQKNTTSALTDSQTPTPLFQTLLDKIFDRDMNLGNVFKNNINFVSFENNTLTWTSQATGQDKEILRAHYSIIKHIIQDIFGIHTKIVQTSISNEKSEKQASFQEQKTSPSLQTLDIQQNTASTTQQPKDTLTKINTQDSHTTKSPQIDIQKQNTNLQISPITQELPITQQEVILNAQQENTISLTQPKNPTTINQEINTQQEDIAPQSTKQNTADVQNSFKQDFYVRNQELIDYMMRAIPIKDIRKFKND